MSKAENFCPRLPGETDADWRDRVRRELADTGLVAELLEIAATGKGITEAERAELLERIQSMQFDADRARAMAMLDAEPAKTAPGRSH